MIVSVRMLFHFLILDQYRGWGGMKNTIKFSLALIISLYIEMCTLSVMNRGVQWKTQTVKLNSPSGACPGCRHQVISAHDQTEQLDDGPLWLESNSDKLEVECH